MNDKLQADVEDREEDAIANKNAEALAVSTDASTKLEEDISSKFNEAEKIMGSHVDTRESPIHDSAVEAFTADPSLVDNERLAAKSDTSRSTPTTPSSAQDEDLAEMADESMSPAVASVSSSVIGSVDSGSSPEFDSNNRAHRLVHLEALAKLPGRSLTATLESVSMDETMPDATNPILTNSPPPTMGSRSSVSSSAGDDGEYVPGASPTFSDKGEGEGEKDEEGEGEKDEEDEDEDEGEDEASSGSDEGKGMVKRASLNRASGARAVLRPKDVNGEDLSEHNCMALVGKHVLVKRTMSSKIEHGQVSLVEVSKSTTPTTIWLQVEVDNGSVEWLKVSGTGRLHNLNWPAQQLPFVDAGRSGIRELIKKFGEGPAPHGKIDINEMTPTCILIDAPRSMPGNTNFRNGLGSKEVAFFPVLLPSGCDEPVARVGDLITYQTINGTTKELNPPSDLFIIIAVGTMLEVNPHSNPNPNPDPDASGLG